MRELSNDPRNVKAREAYKSNKHKTQSYLQKWRSENKDKVKKYNNTKGKEWRKNNKEKYNEYHKNYARDPKTTKSITDLTLEDMINISMEYSNQRITAKVLARKYGLSVGQVYRVLSKMK